MRFFIVLILLLMTTSCRTTVTVEKADPVVAPGPSPVEVKPDE